MVDRETVKARENLFCPRAKFFVFSLSIMTVSVSKKILFLLSLFASALVIYSRLSGYLKILKNWKTASFSFENGDLPIYKKSSKIP